MARIINGIGHSGWKRRAVEGGLELGRPSSVRGGAVRVSLVASAPPAPRAVPCMEGGPTAVVVAGMSKRVNEELVRAQGIGSG